MTTLIVGCSFVGMLSLHESVNQKNKGQWKPVFSRIDTNEYDIWGSTGSGNTAIAHRVLHLIARNTYKKVIVVWSGVNRLDLPVGRDYHKSMPRLNAEEFEYNYFTDLGDTVWYHSGGLGREQNPKMPQALRSMFKAQNLGTNHRFLTDLTLANVIAIQGALTKQGIDYAMGWMYNPLTSDDQSKIELACGKLDQSSPLMNLVDWTTISTHTAYEWVKSRNMLYSDGFHWSWLGGRQWLLEVMGVDIFRI